MKRCEWAGNDALLRAYHDEEWGVPVLKKREGYRKAFGNFDARVVSGFSEDDIATLLADPGIIRNKLKIRAATGNAKALLRVREEFRSFDNYIWRFVNGTPVQNAWNRMTEIPCSTPESEAMSKDLRNRGFKFVGPTICYAFMQAIGMVNDHVVECFRHGILAR
jgi:DNA-3-methyladenine glycosylase I